jgi:hypothetical protein
LGMVMTKDFPILAIAFLKVISLLIIKC